MTAPGALAGIALGIALGARHALEPDHLAAVSVLAADGPGPRRAALVGALWGAGHTMSLVACGIVVMAAASEIPASLADLFEVLVGTMLVALGARAIYRAATAEKHRAVAAAPQPEHVQVARRAVAVRPLVVGAVHGLAGSGALTSLVIAGLPGGHARLLFITLFGLGSVAGMSAISGLAGWPLARLARRSSTTHLVFAATGALSAGLGVAWCWLPLQRLLG